MCHPRRAPRSKPVVDTAEVACGWSRHAGKPGPGCGRHRSGGVPGDPQAQGRGLGPAATPMATAHPTEGGTETEPWTDSCRNEADSPAFIMVEPSAVLTGVRETLGSAGGGRSEVKRSLCVLTPRAPDPPATTQPAPHPTAWLLTAQPKDFLGIPESCAWIFLNY